MTLSPDRACFASNCSEDLKLSLSLRNKTSFSVLEICFCDPSKIGSSRSSLLLESDSLLEEFFFNLLYFLLGNF